MRLSIFFILSLALIVWTSPVMAEYLQGTVVRIDRQGGELEITLSANGQCRMENGKKAVERQNTPRVLVRAAWFPRCLVTGDQVYARGEYAQGSKEIFEAEDVFPCRRRGGHDPTGVRSRFHHHRRQMMRQMGGEMDE